MAKAALAKADLCALRQVIARIEEGCDNPVSFADDHGERRASDIARLGLGVEDFDVPLAGGMPLEGLSEIRAPMTADAGAATGFALGLSALVADRQEYGTILWISEVPAAREAGLPHAAGLLHFGISPNRLLHASPRKLEEALWIAEAALSVNAFTAVILEVRGNPQKFGLTESRRLHLKARNAAVPLFVLRQSGEEEASSALVRICVQASPARGRLLPDGSQLVSTIGHPVFHLTVEKSRASGPFPVFLEWNSHERQFYPARTAAFSNHEPAHFGDHLSLSASRPDSPAEMGRLLAFDRAS